MTMKVSSLFAASLLIAGVANAGGSVVTNDYILGVMPITANLKPQVILSIPWVAEGGSTNAVAVTNLVKTSGLDVGDTLTWYDTEAGAFRQWRLESSSSGTNYWSGALNPDDDYKPIATDEPMLKQGQAIVLQRAHSNNTIYVIGQVGTNSTITTRIAPATGETPTPTYTLVAPPSASNEALDLNNSSAITFVGTISGGTMSFAYNGDEIISESYNKLKSVYRYRTDLGGGAKWVPTSKPDGSVGAIIPMRRGFWYKRAGTTELTIQWPAPAVAP